MPRSCASRPRSRPSSSARTSWSRKNAELRGDRLELDVVQRIEHQRRHRRDRFRIFRVAQQPDGRYPRLRIGIAQVADHVVEPQLLSGRRRPPADDAAALPRGTLVISYAGAGRDLSGRTRGLKVRRPFSWRRRWTRPVASTSRQVAAGVRRRDLARPARACRRRRCGRPLRRLRARDRRSSRRS